MSSDAIDVVARDVSPQKMSERAAEAFELYAGECNLSVPCVADKLGVRIQTVYRWRTDYQWDSLYSRDHGGATARGRELVRANIAARADRFLAALETCAESGPWDIRLEAIKLAGQWLGLGQPETSPASGQAPTAIPPVSLVQQFLSLDEPALKRIAGSGLQDNMIAAQSERTRKANTPRQ